MSTKKAAGSKKKKRGRAPTPPSPDVVVLGSSEGAEEEAEIARIIDERGGDEPKPSSKKKKRGGKKKTTQTTGLQYLCAWTDGEPPQWVDAVHLEGTPALEDWLWREEVLPEIRDAPAVVKEKCAMLCKWFKAAKRPTFMLGAGISASVLPTFRGKAGLWTKDAHLNEMSANSAAQVDPTLAHRALVALEKVDRVYWVATQNYDDLSAKSGYPVSKLSELHGNIFTETCQVCGYVYHRDFEVELSTSKDHETGRTCDQCPSKGVLRDNIIHFGEALSWHQLKMANCKFIGSDLSIVLGSSLNVEPAASLPFKSKTRSRTLNAKSVIVNLQATPRDEDADLVIHATCDEVMDYLARAIIGDTWDPLVL